MTTLTKFLLARYAEDEARWPDRNAMEAPHYRTCAAPGDMWGYCNCPALAHHLAEIEAKRRIVELHDDSWGIGWCLVCAEGVGRLDAENEPYPCPTLRLLALPYADHPSYDEGWRP